MVGVKTSAKLSSQTVHSRNNAYAAGFIRFRFESEKSDSLIWESWEILSSREILEHKGCMLDMLDKKSSPTVENVFSVVSSSSFSEMRRFKQATSARSLRDIKSSISFSTRVVSTGLSDVCWISRKADSYPSKNSSVS